MKVTDETKKMHPHFSYNVKHPTEKLVLKIIIPQQEPFIENVEYKRYADFEMTIPYDEVNKRQL